MISFSEALIVQEVLRPQPGEVKYEIREIKVERRVWKILKA
jgi:hypothetical protein